MSIRALVGPTVLALVVLLTACSASSPPRTRPDAVERAAVAAAHRGVPEVESPDGWVQLWTTNQARDVIERCVDRTSGGFLAVRVSPADPRRDKLPIKFTVVGNFSILLDSFTVPSTANRIVVLCLEQNPIDTRRQLVPARDAGAMYSYDVTVLRRCLLEHGQDVPVAPNRASYERMIRAGTPWSPYDQVEVRDRAAWYSLSDSCPALPPAIAADVAAATTP